MWRILYDAHIEFISLELPNSNNFLFRTPKPIIESSVIQLYGSTQHSRYATLII